MAEHGIFSAGGVLGLPWVEVVRMVLQPGGMGASPDWYYCLADHHPMRITEPYTERWRRTTGSAFNMAFALMTMSPLPSVRPRAVWDRYLVGQRNTEPPLRPPLLQLPGRIGQGLGPSAVERVASDGAVRAWRGAY